MIKLLKPVNYSGAMKQTSIFNADDNYKAFHFEFTEAVVPSFSAKNPQSKWNQKHVTNVKVINQSQAVQAEKTIPIELIEGVVESAGIDGLSMWVTDGTGKNKKEVYNSKLVFDCVNGTLKCLGEA